MSEKLADIIYQFKVMGDVISAEPFGSGHINDTYKVICSEREHWPYLLQRVNHDVFDVPAVMNNFKLVNDKLINVYKDHPDRQRSYLNLIYTSKNRSHHIDTEGNFWRIFDFIPDTIAYDLVEHTDIAFEGARAFGTFISDLRDIPLLSIHTTISDFHNLGLRFAQFITALRSDIAGRAESCRNEITYLINLRDINSEVNKLIHSKSIPFRITHNDTKINNVLFDKNTNKAICVIDLDTVMPGTILSDFGDMVRTFCPTLEEDDEFFVGQELRLDIFQAITNGFCEAMYDYIDPVEKANLLLGGKMMIYMQSLRFLTDYLNNDIYYKTSYETHNLVRAQNQVALLRDLIRKEKDLRDILNKN